MCSYEWRATNNAQVESRQVVEFVCVEFRHHFDSWRQCRRVLIRQTGVHAWTMICEVEMREKVINLMAEVCSRLSLPPLPSKNSEKKFMSSYFHTHMTCRHGKRILIIGTKDTELNGSHKKKYFSHFRASLEYEWETCEIFNGLWSY